MSLKKSNHVLAAIRNHHIVFLIMFSLATFGIYSLSQMNKDEFPQFTIRQGVVAAIYPGASAQEVEEQVTKPLERFLFTYSEIDQKRTRSVTENGIVYVFAELRVEVTDKDEVWSKIRHGLQLFKKTSLPAGVLEMVVVDDFGNTSSMLLAVESAQRTPRELESYAETICDRLRNISMMGKLKILGQQREEIAVLIDPEKLSAYGIDQRALLVELSAQGFRTVSGMVENSSGEAMIHVSTPYQSEYEIGEQIVYSDLMGGVVRLRDIAKIERRYEKPDSYIKYNGEHSMIISMEMAPNNNIVAFGRQVSKVMEEAKEVLPPDVQVHKITDQPFVVGTSVKSFLRDLVISILVVIAVMMLLFPLRTALIAGSSVPICTAVTLGLMYVCGIELNTVTLAALIVVLGMIVDDSVIVVDGYVETLRQGHSRLYSAVQSTTQLFVAMSLATLAISGMFFPMTRIITGPLGEFVQLFPWTLLFALGCSIFYAAWVIPYLSTQVIFYSKQGFTGNRFEALQNRFFIFLQESYDKLLTRCFKHPAITIGTVVSVVLLGVFLLSQLNIQMLPKADRNCFAVEIHLTHGSTLEQTAAVADSVEHVLRLDPRVTSVSSFIGTASPRFHATYAPQMARKNYAQFIVNTTSEKATIQLIKEYAPRYENAFANAYVRFKQMDYQAADNPVEIYLSGNNLDELKRWSDTLKTFMHTLPELTWVHSNMDETSQNIAVVLDMEEATRLGIAQSTLSLYLSSLLGGRQLTTLWDGDYSVPVMLYSQKRGKEINYQEIENLPVPTALPAVWVPLRQVATVIPEWSESSIHRRNSIRTVTVGADLNYGVSQPEVMKKIDHFVENEMAPQFSNDVKLEYGGLTSLNNGVIPEILLSILAAILVLFLFLLYHFAKIDIVMLTLGASLICIFGACLGLSLFGLDFSITATLGVVSLIGIIVRNAIIMFEYAEFLRKEKHLTAKEAAFEAGRRRMRPIFLTSVTTALGVAPMIIAHTALWMPMGVVICFGTIFSLPLVVTFLPVMYWQVFKYGDKKKTILKTENTTIE